MPSSITDRFESLTGLDIDGNGSVGSSSPPPYPLLSSSYASLKSAWSLGKSYKIVRTLEEAGEAVAERVVKVVAKTTLGEIDLSLSPQLARYDYKVSPMVANTVAFAAKKKEENEGIIKLVARVVPVETCASAAGVFYGILSKNLSAFGKVLLIENPETTSA